MLILIGTNFCDCIRQVFCVELKQISYIGTLFIVLFIQNSVLFRVRFRQVSLSFYTGFCFIQGSVLFRVRFKQVYTEFCFIQGSVQTSIYRILFYSGFSLNKSIQNSVLFRVGFRQVYTEFCFIQGSVQTSLYRILFYSGFSLDKYIQNSVLFRVSVQTSIYRILFYSGFGLGIISKCDSFFQTKLVSFGRWVVFSCHVWKKNKIAH